MVKLPRTPPARLTIADTDLVDWRHPMVRVHGTRGAHALPWWRLRHFGPLPARFEPHPLPLSEHEQRAVMYVAGDLDTVLAEVFQVGRTVVPDAPNAPYLTVWIPARPLRLLDVTGRWPLRNGASHALNTGPHNVCRAWARAIAAHPAAVDGISYTSSMTGANAAALYLPAADSLPATPLMSLPLTHPGLTALVDAAAERIGYHVDR